MLTLFSSSDSALVQQVLRGRTDKFGEIVRRYHPVLYGVALSHLGNRADAEDIVQDSFLRAYENLPKLREVSKLGAWLATITRNRCMDLLQKRQREIPLTPDVDIAIAPPDAERKEAHELLLGGLQRLDVETRELLMLYYFAKKDTREIASILEISVDAARKRLQRARTLLGQELVDVLGGQLLPEETKTPVKRIMAALPPLGYGASTPGLTMAGAGVKYALATLCVAASVTAAVVLLPLAASPKTPAPTPTVMAVQDAPEQAVQVQEREERGWGTSTQVFPAAPDANNWGLLSVEVPAIAASAEPDLSGIVLDKEGQPLPDMRVNVWSDSDAAQQSSATTDEKGRFSVASLTPGFYSLQAVPAEAIGHTRMQHLALEMKAGQKLDNVVINYPGLARLSISGRVMDTKRRPVENAELDVRGPIDISLKTGKEGEFLVRFLEEGDYGFFVSHSRFTRNRKVIVHPAGSTGVEIMLQGVAAVAGRVVDPHGQPIANARVMALPKVHAERAPIEILFAHEQSVQRTDAQGTFLIDPVPAGGADLMAVSDGFAPTLVRIDSLEAGEQVDQVVLKLSPGARVDFEVKDAAGAPVPAAAIRLGDDVNDYDGDPPGAQRGTRNREAGRTDTNGRLTLTSLPPGRLKYLIHAPGFAPTRDQLIVQEQADQNHLVRLDKGALISGTLTIDGKPVLEGSVNVRHPGQESIPVSSVFIRNGKYETHGVLPGTVIVRAHVQQPNMHDELYVERRLEVEAGQQLDCSWELRTGNCGIEGQVTQNGEPVQTEVQVEMSPGEVPVYRSTWSREDGYYNIQNLPPGVATVSIRIRGAKPGLDPAKITLLEGQTVQQDLAAVVGSAKLAFSVDNAPEGSMLHCYLLAELPTPEVLDSGTVELLEENSVREITIPDWMEKAFEWELSPGKYTLLAVATDEWTNEAYEDALLTSTTVTIEENGEPAQVNLSF